MLKKLLWFLLAVFLLVGGIVVYCDTAVSRNADGRTYSDAGDVPHRRYGLVLGTSPISTWSGGRNWYFDYRIRAAARLYELGKVDWLIVSGGDYRQEGGYDEPMAMRDSLIGRGVDPARIVLDYDGTRTLNSIAKVKDVYHVDSIILISQKFHNERALYQSDHLGVNAIALNAVTPPRRASRWRNRGRECLARVKLFVDILRGVSPDIKETMHPLRNIEPECPALLTYSNVHTKHGDLISILPDMSVLTIDLVCGSVPDADADSVVMAFAGAFTGKEGDKSHGNVAGDHVAGGVRYPGYRCDRNTGAFTWSAVSGPRFHYKDYSQAIDQAASEGGMAFAQEMMIHDGKKVKTTRPLDNRHQYRALCLDADGRLAVFESCGTVTFGSFIDSLLDAGVTEALYTDMGPGWNHCFFRQRQGLPVTFLHNHPDTQATNFVTFLIPSL